jgi:ketosteroid isomerase-like protein
MRANDLKIDVFGEVAVVTFLVNSSFKVGTDNLERQARSTLVFVKDQGTWKITHEHFSPLKSNP